MNKPFGRCGLTLCATAALLFTNHALAGETNDASGAQATPPVDIGFGVRFGSDYIFRSQTQTDGKPTVQGYIEGRFFDWFYAGIFMSNVRFPASPWGLSDPALEIDYSVGLRHTWDKFSLDVGFAYFTYPGQLKVGALGNGLPATDINMWEITAKPSFVIADIVTVGGVLSWSPDFSGTGAPQTYLAGTLRVELPKPTSFGDVSWYASGELGYQWLGTTDLKSLYIPDSDLPDFTVWNVGVGIVYKSATLDLRYWGSTLRNGPDSSCFMATSINNACGDRFVATLSFDTSLLALK